MRLRGLVFTFIHVLLFATAHGQGAKELSTYKRPKGAAECHVVVSLAS